MAGPTPEQKKQLVEYLRQPRRLRRLDRERFSKECLGVSRRTMYAWTKRPEIQAMLEPDLEAPPSPEEIEEEHNLPGWALGQIIARAQRGDEWALKYLARGLGDSPFACPSGYGPQNCPLVEMQTDLHTLPKGLVSDLFVQFMAEVLQEITLPPSERRTLREWLIENATNHVAQAILEEAFPEEPETSP